MKTITTVMGDTWDTIALQAYGDTRSGALASPHISTNGGVCKMEQEHFDAPPSVPDRSSAGLENVRFPDESALGDAISEAQATADRQAERLAYAVQGACPLGLKGSE